jgi:hypothetical protein
MGLKFHIQNFQIEAGHGTPEISALRRLNPEDES